MTAPVEGVLPAVADSYFEWPSVEATLNLVRLLRSRISDLGDARFAALALNAALASLHGFDQAFVTAGSTR